MPQTKKIRRWAPANASAARPPNAWPPSSTRLYQASNQVRCAASMVSGRIACSSVPAGPRSRPMPLSLPTNAAGISDTGARGCRGGEVAEAGRQRDDDQRSSPSESIRRNGHDRRHRRDPDEAGADDHPSACDGHAGFRQSDCENDADEADRRRSEECRRVDQPGVTATNVARRLSSAAHPSDPARHERRWRVSALGLSPSSGER
jgi:hypothetical protein